MIFTLARIVVGVTVERIDASPGHGLTELSAQGGRKDRPAEDTADVVTDQQARAKGIHRLCNNGQRIFCSEGFVSEGEQINRSRLTVLHFESYQLATK